MSIKKYIPNSITSMNLLCGVCSTVLSIMLIVMHHVGVRIIFPMDNIYFWSSVLIFAGAVFDFFDGFAARWLHVSSSIGKELDSLADLITFGFAPSALYALYMASEYDGVEFNRLLVFAPFLMVLFAALRLAKFNVDERQTESFIGLTTTATAMFTASLMLSGIKLPYYVILGLVAVFCYLLVSEIPMFSLKLKHFRFKGNELRYVLVGTAVVLIAIMGFGGVAATILLYIVFSIIQMFLPKK